MKVLPCSKRYVHDWTTCPFAHPQEKARRRDPRIYNYTGIACPNMKKARPDGTCPLREHCPYAHNVFEYWLHPTRYRTQLCNDGPNCRRKICFFAHSLEELRVPTAKPFVSPESLAAASAAVAAEDGPAPALHGARPSAASGTASEGDSSRPSQDSLGSSGAPSGRPHRAEHAPGEQAGESAQQLAVVELVASLLRQGRLTGAQASAILQQNLGPQMVAEAAAAAGRAGPRGRTRRSSPTGAPTRRCWAWRRRGPAALARRRAARAPQPGRAQHVLGRVGVVDARPGPGRARRASPRPCA
ncbi:hypothetical protein QBZ16_000058 [Prototheca wickerhamii]|uniref:C3H1-type domain-containing protein n=1 Tax=Prototheca wickerhamii TaxID=3111 RepID=A0AAD9MLT6_PROWI|nr:hypothetical protein QBZ16_000058 [Prototheca wickerhamii]